MATFAQNCLDGKTVLITGGLGAIGKVVVSSLLSHSARVAVNDVLSTEQAAQIGNELDWPSDRFVYVHADVTKPEGAEELVTKTLAAFGRLDVALCHAGMAHSCPILQYSEAEWDKIMNLNLKSAFLVAQAAARAMVERDIKGKIVFTSSWVQDVPWPDITPYNVTKSGMKMLMKGMARELAGKGIRVNGLAPGIVGVGMGKRQWDTEPDYRRRAERAIPLGYLQPPESVADAILFLCSEASDYITGTTLLADGGCSLYPMD
ncbi:MAG: SDR family oxidoreductase [Terriglobia bacterium]|jgi:NAD(P)-dependent dehydrogenase (short-subunit alcohol dehydrogenase family)